MAQTALVQVNSFRNGRQSRKTVGIWNEEKKLSFAPFSSNSQWMKILIPVFKIAISSKLIIAVTWDHHHSICLSKYFPKVINLLGLNYLNSNKNNENVQLAAKANFWLSRKNKQNSFAICDLNNLTSYDCHF